MGGGEWVSITKTGWSSKNLGHRLKKMTYRFLIDLMGVTLIAVWAIKKIVQNYGVKKERVAT